MDDTTWISNSKDNLEKQLTIANNFNRFNGIRVNAAKSKLLVLNSKIPSDKRFIKYGKHESIIYPEVDGTSVRFLGVWISNKFNKNFVLNQTLKDVAQIYNITKSKMITAEQTTYVINAVAIPRIEYKSHLTVFNEAEAKKITMKLRKLLRYKIGLLNTAPNVLLNIKQIYNMINFYDRQTENHVSNLLLRLNDLGILGLTTEIRLRQLQQKEWLHDCPLEVWNYNNVNTFKYNLIGQVLCLMNSLGLSINPLYHQKESFKMEPGNVPLIDIFKNDYRNNVTSFKKKDLMHLEQLMYKGSISLTCWDELNMKFKGKKPNWWSDLKTKVIDKDQKLLTKYRH